MDSQLLNKLTPQSRQFVIQAEARLREIDEEKQVLNSLINGRGIFDE